MDNSQQPNTPEKPTRRHTIDVNLQTTTPRYDFVVPSYSRDRRVSSITTTLPPGTILGDGVPSVNIQIPEQDSAEEQRAENNETSKNTIKYF